MSNKNLQKFLERELTEKEHNQIISQCKQLENVEKKLSYLVLLASRGIVLEFLDFIFCLGLDEPFGYGDYLDLCLKHIKNKLIIKKIMIYKEKYQNI